MPDIVVDLVTAAVLLFFGWRLVGALRRVVRPEARRRIAVIVRGIRWRHIWPVPFLLTAVAATALTLIQLPVLSFGWWTAIGGTGNPVTGGTERTAGTPFEILIPLVFLLLLLPSLPLFAEAEERMFRLGAEDWSNLKRVRKAVTFGLVHAIIGIPIGVALALSLGGLWFTRAYLQGHRRGGPREGLLESTRAHTAYNGLIVCVFLALYLLVAVLDLVVALVGAAPVG